jgi:hypothetical protein
METPVAFMLVVVAVGVFMELMLVVSCDMCVPTIVEHSYHI